MSLFVSTLNSNSRKSALTNVIKQIDQLIQCQSIAYKFNQSGCSCCLSESFDLLCKIGDDYKLLSYDAYIKHTHACLLIRCTCKQPFVWKHILPIEQNVLDVNQNNEYINTFIPLTNNLLWLDEYYYYYEVQQQNQAILIYNNDEVEDEINSQLKNYSYYFCK
jgi:hypothetical protein